MAKETFDWNNMYEGKEVKTGDNSEVRTSVIERSDGEISGIVTIRKWAKYIKKDERMHGLLLDDMEFRPTKDGLSIPISALPALIKELEEMKDWAEKERLIIIEDTPKKTTSAIRKAVKKLID